MFVGHSKPSHTICKSILSIFSTFSNKIDAMGDFIFVLGNESQDNRVRHFISRQEQEIGGLKETFAQLHDANNEL